MTKTELKNKESFSFDDLCAIVDILRAPDGCPWDKVQTHKTLRNNLIEEAYETVEGIDREASDVLREELGDVLLQVLFHAGIARDSGEFTLKDVISGICRKMIRRHPHIFSGESVEESKIQDKWDEIKRAEKGARSTGDAMRAVSGTLPALMRAEKIAEKCGGATLRREILLQGDPILSGGDALYRVCLDLMRQGICPEEALQKYLKELMNDPASYESRKESPTP